MAATPMAMAAAVLLPTPKPPFLQPTKPLHLHLHPLLSKPHLSFCLSTSSLHPLEAIPSPDLTTKEKKELASYAHGLGDKLKSQLVGKSGVTPSVAAAFVENLESNELLKIKIHGTCPGEFVDVVKQLEESTGSVAISQIGRSVILYRPSITKMKKREAQSGRKIWTPRPPFPSRMQKNQVSRSVSSSRGRAK